ncbi:unnamed protein product [Schistosoma rodhaini]|uniref:MKRN2 opposite strand protein-like C-terminal domain-containing protein n=1 Tax=Schistosoma rodhaini TaxID=6188 RepID=A0AA85FX15_9TREM|nr:unnamed protein product [Schistosoma rodhaini]
MIHSKILAVKHSCFNKEDNDENYLCAFSKSPEKCLQCGTILKDEIVVKLMLPFSNAHVSILFPSYPIAKIAFILSDSSNSILNYQSNSNLHCGVIDSEGKVYHFTKQYGISIDSMGWEQSIIVNVSEVTGCKNLTSSKWNETIHSYVNNLNGSIHSYVNDLNGSIHSYVNDPNGSIHSYVNDPNGSIHSSMNQDYDCLDFVVDIIKYAINDQEVNRIRIAQWLSNQLEWVLLYTDIIKQLESGSLQVMKRLPIIAICQY